jgi:peptide/nickel transport system substrate-binding protein
MSINRRTFNQLLLLSTAGTLVPSLGLKAAEDKPKQGGTLTFIVEPEPPTILALAHTAGGTQKVSPKITVDIRRRLELHVQATPQRQMA